MPDEEISEERIKTLLRAHLLNLEEAKWPDLVRAQGLDRFTSKFASLLIKALQARSAAEINQLAASLPSSPHPNLGFIYKILKNVRFEVVGSDGIGSLDINRWGMLDLLPMNLDEKIKLVYFYCYQSRVDPNQGIFRLNTTQLREIGMHRAAQHIAETSNQDLRGRYGAVDDALDTAAREFDDSHPPSIESVIATLTSPDFRIGDLGSLFSGVSTSAASSTTQLSQMAEALERSRDEMLQGIPESACSNIEESLVEIDGQAYEVKCPFTQQLMVNPKKITETRIAADGTTSTRNFYFEGDILDEYVRRQGLVINPMNRTTNSSEVSITIGSAPEMSAAIRNLINATREAPHPTPPTRRTSRS